MHLLRRKFDRDRPLRYYKNAGWSSLVARWAHNPKVEGSNPSPATNFFSWLRFTRGSTHLMGQVGLRPISRTHYLNSQSVVLEVSEAVGLTLEDFHFGVEAFGDAVVAGEAPHAGDFLPPGIQGIPELCEWREPATTERSHLAQETVGQLAALLGGTMLLQQQVAQSLFKRVDCF